MKQMVKKNGTYYEVRKLLYVAKISVEEYYNEGTNSVDRKAYHLQGIKIEPVGEGYAGNKSAISLRSDTGSTISISDLFSFVKRFDKDFRGNPKKRTPKAIFAVEFTLKIHAK